MSIFDDTTKNIPPHSIEAEQAVLGAMMIGHEPAAKALSVLSAEDFYPEVHRIIYVAMQDAAGAGDPIDLITVCGRLQTNDQLKTVGGADYLTALIGTVPTTAHAPRYIKIVKELSVKRRIMAFGADIAARASGIELDEIVAKIQEEALSLLAAGRQQRGAQSFADIFEPFVKWQDEEMKKDWSVRGAQLGIPSIDHRLGGLADQTVVIIVGFTGYGKTSLLRQSALETAQKAGPVLVYLLEGNPMSWMMGCVSWLARVPESKCGRAGYKRQTEAETKRIVDAWQALPGLPVWFGSDVRTIGDIQTDIVLRFEQMGEPPVAVYIDYLQLVECPTTDGQMEAVMETVKMCAALNERFRVPIITASQITITDGRHATRWSKDAENAASLTLEIERGALGSAESKNPDLARWKDEIRLVPVKQRIGERLKRTELKPEWDYGRFYDIDERWEQKPSADEFTNHTPEAIKW